MQLPAIEHIINMCKSGRITMHQIGGTWKMPILWRLNEQIMRYSDLKSIYLTSPTTQLRGLEGNAFVTRSVYPVVPPKLA